MCFRLVAGCRRESIPALRVPPLFLFPSFPFSLFVPFPTLFSAWPSLSRTMPFSLSHFTVWLSPSLLYSFSFQPPLRRISLLRPLSTLHPFLVLSPSSFPLSICLSTYLSLLLYIFYLGRLITKSVLSIPSPFVYEYVRTIFFLFIRRKRT